MLSVMWIDINWLIDWLIDEWIDSIDVDDENRVRERNMRFNKQKFHVDPNHKTRFLIGMFGSKTQPTQTRQNDDTNVWSRYQIREREREITASVFFADKKQDRKETGEKKTKQNKIGPKKKLINFFLYQKKGEGDERKEQAILTRIEWTFTWYDSEEIRCCGSESIGIA